MRPNLFFLFALVLLPAVALGVDELTFPVVDTGQIYTFGERGTIDFPKPGEPFFGQDAQFERHPPAYRDNGDGTVTDLVTGLMWQKDPAPEKMNQADAEAYAETADYAGYDDWRLPTIKELFSLANFMGNMRTRTPYLDTTAFGFVYPDSTVGERGTPGQRNMDAQYASSTHYLGRTMANDESAFGFNFADGRIKSYPLRATRYVRLVRGNSEYGINKFIDNGDGTVTDRATGLTWAQLDSDKPMTWREALAYAESLELGGKDDWRLPSVKELQGIVDYTRAPDAEDPDRRGPAIDPILKLHDPAAWHWTSTTHIENRGAYYVCFGRALSARMYRGKPMDAHGAGAVRSDPKTGDAADFPDGFGPQGDEVRIRNYVRVVRDDGPPAKTEGPRPDSDETLFGGRPMMGSPASSGDRPERRGGPERRPPGNGGAGFLQRFDENGDGKVSRGEFPGPDDRFERLDSNGDGAIDATEAPTRPPPPRR